MHRFYRDWLGRGYVGLFYCGERTAKGSKVTGGEIQSRNDDPRRKPGGTRLKGDALSFPQPVLRNGTQWYAMATTERCPPKKPKHASGYQPHRE